MKINKREQWLLFAAAFIGVLYISQQYLFSAQFEKIKTVKNNIKVNQLKIEALKSKEARLKKMQGVERSDKVKRKTKEEIAMAVLSYIADNVTALNLNLISLRPDYSTAASGQANFLRFDLIIEGNYNQVYKFMRAIEESENPLVIDLFKIEHKDGSAVAASISLSAYY